MLRFGQSHNFTFYFSMSFVYRKYSQYRWYQFLNFLTGTLYVQYWEKKMDISVVHVMAVIFNSNRRREHMRKFITNLVCTAKNIVDFVEDTNESKKIEAKSSKLPCTLIKWSFTGFLCMIHHTRCVFVPDTLNNLFATHQATRWS